jgi:hypothetical protein
MVMAKISRQTCHAFWPSDPIWERRFSSARKMLILTSTRVPRAIGRLIHMRHAALVRCRLMSQKKRRLRPGTRPSGHLTEEGRKNQIASRLAYGVKANSPALPGIEDHWSGNSSARDSEISGNLSGPMKKSVLTR